MAAILIFAPSEDDISVLFLKNSILFFINSIKVKFFANILIFRGDFEKKKRKKIEIFFKKMRGDQIFERAMGVPPSKKMAIFF